MRLAQLVSAGGGERPHRVAVEMKPGIVQLDEARGIDLVGVARGVR